MKNYIRPSVEVSKFDVADIITASGELQNANALIGTDYATIYDQYSAAAQTAGLEAQAAAAVFQW